jgi:hypothetical protein
VAEVSILIFYGLQEDSRYDWCIFTNHTSICSSGVAQSV